MKVNINRSIYNKIETFFTNRLRKIYHNQLNNDNFSIICNNCWGGYVYRRYGIRYNSPTIGLYFFAEDFIKFCYNLKEYMGYSLKFIKAKDSKWYKELKQRNQLNVPIARLNDIEIIFLHYKTKKEAMEKWNRRAKRINYDNLIFKFSKMNYCSEKELNKFDKLNCKKKICFVPKKQKNILISQIKFKSEKGNEIVDDTSEYSRYINLTKLINAKEVSGKKIIFY